MKTTNEFTVQTKHGELTFSDSDAVDSNGNCFHQRSFNGCSEVDECSYEKLYIVFDQFGTRAVVFARCEQEAIDTAIDAGKLDSLKVSEEDLQEAQTGEYDDEFLCGGNAGEYFHQDYLNLVEIPKPAFSLVALFQYAEKNTETTEENK